MSTTWKARPTTYKGIEMRSRLEATYAASLDAEGECWSYEPRAYADDRGQYLPDFEVVYGATRLFIEVRPTVTKALEAMGRMEIIWSSEPTAFLMIDVPGKLTFFRAPSSDGWECHDRYNVFGERD